MRHYRFRLLNVFAQTPLGGNPLAVVEDARGLSDEEMQALALQFNLSETTFLLPSDRANARVRIFTPNFEMPFAGHPTLGSAHAVRGLTACGDNLTLEMRAGVIPVVAQGNVWTLRANAPTHRPHQASRHDVASAIGLSADDIAGDPLWVDTGSEQLIVPLVNADAVKGCSADGKLMAQHCSNGERSMIYVWARDGVPAGGVQSAVVRFFFPKGGAPCEDPGTGSACANLGGYLLATGEPLPLRWELAQGAQINKPCTLFLDVDSNAGIHVGGRVVELGNGEIQLPD